MAGDCWRDGGWRKQLIDRHFLERREAEDLQNCVETGLEREAFSDDGDQDIDGDGDPDLRANGILASCQRRP